MTVPRFLLSIAALAGAYGAGWYFAQGHIYTKEGCAAAARQQALLLRDINPGVIFESARWKSFDRSCLAGYSYSVPRDAHTATREFIVLDLQRGKPVFEFDTRFSLEGNIEDRPRTKHPEPITTGT